MANRKICLVALFCCAVLLLPSMSVGDCGFNDTELEPGARSPYDTNPSYTWPKGQIPYVFTSSVGEADKQVFYKNMKLIEKHTCFKYYEQTSIPSQKYLEINVENKGSANSCTNGWFSAYVTAGYVRTNNKMLLHSEYQLADDASCRGKSMFEGGILHEMFHSLGVMHTQKRADRDTYVTVIKDNIQDPTQYSVCEHCKIYPQIPYECNSIMHYGTKTLGKKDAGPTMTARNTNTCKLQDWGYSTPTENDWKLLKIIADRVCSGTGGGSETGGCKYTDKSTSCPRYKSYCNINLQWMGDNCAKTCKCGEAEAIGTWSSWQNYGQCSVTAGSGTQNQKRTCVGGSGCQGESSRTITFTKAACCKYTDTSTYKHICPLFKSYDYCNFNRFKTWMGDNCAKTCKCGEAKAIGTWSSWQNYGQCSVSCGSGTQKQKRTCEGGTCEGESSRYVTCTKAACCKCNC